VVHGHPVAEKELAELFAAAEKARKFLRVYHWNSNAPGRGCWDLDAAKAAHEALTAALPLMPTRAICQVTHNGRKPIAPAVRMV
jgi:hypothetical protein